MVALSPTLLLSALNQAVSFSSPFLHTTATTLALPEGWSYQNCYQHSESGHALPVKVYSGSANSLSFCVAKCENAGFAFAGTSSGEECWCGDELVNSELDTCSEPCSNDSSQTCGGRNQMSVFSNWSTTRPTIATTPSKRAKRTTLAQRHHSLSLNKRASASQSLGCFVDANTRVLSLASTSSSTGMTTASCQSFCASHTPSLPYYGTENGNECWCGSAPPPTSLAASSSDCSTTCTGDSNSKCGGAWRINVYGPSTWTSMGCFADQNARTLAGPTYTDAAMTPALCQQKCAGYAYAGTEYQTQCFCGNSMTVSTPSTGCSLTCGGDSSQICGGGWALNVYKTSATAPPTTSAWTSMGCYVDQSARTLAAATFTDAAMTPALCQTKCAGYAYSGVEYGTECYCANSMSNSATSSGCTSTCGGDSSKTCGGGWAINVYHLSGAATSVTTSTSTAASAPTGGSTVTTQSTSGSWWTANGSNTGKAVTAHVIVGNTYGRTSADWTNDIKLAAAQNIDAFALNMGSDSWQPDRMQDAYDAAAALSSQGITFKMFVSFDMTSLNCGSTGTIVSIMQRFASHPAQMKTSAGEMWVSTFDGGSCSMWQSTLNSAGVSYKFIPAFFNDISGATMKAQQPAMGGDFLWGGCWPSSDTPISWDNDNYRIERNGINRGAGDIYMASVSPWFFVHLNSGRNSIFRSDDWLYLERWEMLHDQRSLVDAVEIISWNDWGESHYISTVDPDTGDIPAGANYASPQFDHTAFLAMTGYYASYFKTGNRPTVTADKIFMWSRTHSAGLSIGSDPIGPVQNSGWTTDMLIVVLFATSPGTLTINQGGTSWSQAVVAGPNKLSHGLVSTSSVTAVLTRNGGTVFTFTAPLTYGQSTPSEYNFNVISAAGP
ncbi:hypothetical protein FRB96_002198 [Tulasnella sp. 330]|nr:hypothetical protein FRB96_002198 [Tulasnella sp. 330]